MGEGCVYMYERIIYIAVGGMKVWGIAKVSISLSWVGRGYIYIRVYIYIGLGELKLV